MTVDFSAPEQIEFNSERRIYPIKEIGTTVIGKLVVIEGYAARKEEEAINNTLETAELGRSQEATITNILDAIEKAHQNGLVNESAITPINEVKYQFMPQNTPKDIGHQRARLIQLAREIKFHGRASIPWPPWPSKEHRQNLIVAPQTHIDMEWKMTFDETLKKVIVPMVNNVIELLEAEPDYKFTFDGQVESIYDYLETLSVSERSNAIDKISKHVKSGRLSIGPFGRSVDTLHESGELQMNNLDEGIQKSKAFGSVMMIGHFPDQFGLTSGIAKILNRAGIYLATGVRGIPRSMPRLIRLSSADGSAVTLLNIPEGYNHTNLGKRDFLNAARRNRRQPSLFLAGSDQSIPRAGVVHAARKAGVRLGTLSDHFDALNIKKHEKEVQGELRHVGDHFLLPNVTSNRVDLRFKKAEIEREHERYSEFLATLFLNPYPQEEFDYVWKLRRMLGTHDSSNATVTDQVARDIEKRLDEIKQITSSISDRAAEQFARRLKTAGVYVWNPSNFTRDFWIQENGQSRLARNVPPLGWTITEPAEFVENTSPKLPPIRFTTQRDHGDTYTFNPKRKEVDLNLPLIASQHPGEPFTRINIAWKNSEKNHRDRILIKLPEPAHQSIADSVAFDHVVRPAVPELTQGRDRLNGNPAPRFVIAGGLAILFDRNAEYEILPRTNEIAITLLRAHGALSITNPKFRYLWAGPRVKTQDTQVLKPVEWNIGIMPWTSSALPYKEWEMFALAPKIFSSRGGGNLGETGVLIRNIPSGVLSAMKPGLIRSFTETRDHTIIEQAPEPIYKF